jgi:hypothetical protein
MTARGAHWSRVHYATLFDRHYLSRGLALYQSLARHSPPFVLWVLCLDEATHAVLERLALSGVRPVQLAELERFDPDLKRVRGTRRAVEYYWTCGPAFLHYVWERLSAAELLAYLDADLLFFGDPTPLFEPLRNGSALLVEHRFSASVPQLTKRKGRFNVGFMAFRRGGPARACISRWREQCLEWCFDRVEPTRFGDQKYLEDWPRTYPGVQFTPDLGAILAPWNLEDYRVTWAGGRVLVDGEPLRFYHFNRFRIVRPWLFDPALWFHGQRMTPVLKRHVYVPYARELRRAGALVRAAGGKIPAVDSLRLGDRRPQVLARMLRHRSFLIVTDRLAL